MELTFPTKPFKTHGGADVPHRKNTAQIESAVMPPPAQVVIPMQQHVGAPCTPIVKVGDSVLVGQKIADSSAFISAPIHSSVSGKVTKIQKVMLPAGQYTDAIVIDSVSMFLPSGFPAYVKLKIPEGKNIDTLIVNVAECEPYITADNREAIENSWAVLSGVYAVRDLLNLDRVIIAVEDNKPDVIKVLSKIADNEKLDPKDIVRVFPLRARYPQGAEKVLVKACTDREIPMGKLPADVGCLVMNVTSIAFIANYLKTGMPLVKKRVTIDGSAIKNPKNVIVPIGTKISDIVEFLGGYKAEPKKILMGGPMMGLALVSDQLPVLKQNNGILAFDENEARMSEPTACIRCGRCVEGCPMNLIPTQLEQFSNSKDIEGLKEYDVMDCMECGTCAFNCPAGRPLVQSIRLGKGLVKAAGGKK